MTGREIIRRLVETCCDLDKNVVIKELFRDEFGGVSKSYIYSALTIVNGKIYLEGNSKIESIE